MNASAAAGFGLGLALAGAPGPVQAVLLAEGLRGGLGRGFQAMAAANGTFGLLLIAVALGVTVATPTGAALRLVEFAGGAFLLWLALDGLRARVQGEPASGKGSVPAAARGALAVALNPGGWLFLATAATSLFPSALQLGGRAGAVIAALSLVTGLAVGDAAVVLFGGIGLRRAGAQAVMWVRRVLATVLGVLGVGLLARGLLG